MVDHYAEIEECPSGVYRLAVRQDAVEGGFGSKSALVGRGGNPVTLGVLWVSAPLASIPTSNCNTA